MLYENAILDKCGLRKFFRVDTTLEYAAWLCDFSDKPSKELEVDSGGRVNISGGGFQFLCHKKIQSKSKLLLHLYLHDNKVVTTLSEVVRCDPHESQNSWFSVAVSFFEIAMDQQDHIIKFVSDTQRDQIKKGVWIESK